MITCRDATAWLLEADVHELQAAGDPAMAEHLATCSGCAVRASRIARDTAWLGRAVHAADDHPSKPLLAELGVERFTGRWLPPVGVALLAASIVALVLTHTSRTGEQHASRAARAELASTPSPPAPFASSKPDARHSSDDGRPRSIDRSTEPQSPTVRHETVVAIAPLAITPESVPAIATLAVRLDSLHDEDSSATEARPSLAVDVVPSTGRYAVLGSTPKVTVVWFY